MVSLRALRVDEFSDYQQYFIEDYGQEIAQNFGHSLTHAYQLAESALEDSFPAGEAIPNHFLMCIEDSDNQSTQRVGFLWYALNTPEASAFIYDFYMLPEYRSRGYGRDAMAVFESQLKNQGITQINLRVAFNNKRALSLYQRVGFSITGYNMGKDLNEKSGI